MNLLPKNRVTTLFSATMTKKVEDLCRLSLKNPVLVEVAKDAANSTVAGLEQGYVIIEPSKKFQLLFTFLKKNLKKKTALFFSCSMGAQLLSMGGEFVSVMNTWQVRKTALFAPFIYKMYYFTKTGSGQT